MCPSCVDVFLHSFFNFSIEEGEKIKSALSSILDKRTWRIWDLFKKCLFPDIESSLEAAFQKGIVSISAPSFCHSYAD